MDSHTLAPTHKKTAPYMLGVAAPATDLGQFAREALWTANERDLELTLAVREIPARRRHWRFRRRLYNRGRNALRTINGIRQCGCQAGHEP